MKISDRSSRAVINAGRVLIAPSVQLSPWQILKIDKVRRSGASLPIASCVHPKVDAREAAGYFGRQMMDRASSQLAELAARDRVLKTVGQRVRFNPQCHCPLTNRLTG